MFDIKFWGNDPDISLLDLVQNRTLDLKMAAFFWMLAERKASVIVAAPPRLAGKSTVLNAILQMAPNFYEVVTTKGVQEDFAFLSKTDPKYTYILVPEISDHLPMYLWGDGVLRVFEAVKDGYSLAATMHSDSPEDITAQLQSPDVGVTAELLSCLHVVVNLYMGEQNSQLIRRVQKVSVQTSDGDGPAPVSFSTAAVWNHRTDTWAWEEDREGWHGLAERLGMTYDEFRRAALSKENILRGWLENGKTSTAGLRQSLESYYDTKYP